MNLRGDIRRIADYFKGRDEGQVCDECHLDYKPIEDICLKAVASRFRRDPVGR